MKKIITDNDLTERHARALLKLKDEQLQLKVLRLICEKKLNVKKTEELVKKAINKYMKNVDKKENSIATSIKNIGLFVKILKDSIKSMRKLGLDVKAAKIDKGDYVEFIIRVPKNK